MLGHHGGMKQEFEVIFEFHRVGDSLKVSAVDPVSLTEVSVLGPPSAGEFEMRRIALQKLRYVLERKPKNNTSAMSHSAKARSDRRSRSERQGPNGWYV
ncbi:MAG: hypothetical protein AAF530_12625 [Pseudomonadota bacterium]